MAGEQMDPVFQQVYADMTSLLDSSVTNGNAMEAKLNPTKDALFIEAKDSPYANIVAVRKGDENRPEIQKLMKALNSPEVKKFIEEKYKGAIIPAF